MKYPTACLFPTTTVLLDDEPDYLESLIDNISAPQFKLKPFGSQDEVANYLNASFAKHELTANWMKKTVSEDVFENTAFEICYSKIERELDDQSRSQRVTTLVVDYEMPTKNGLEFIRSLDNIPVKKILLTGAADLNIAINAVNDNLIDAYFKKEDENLLPKLTKKLNEYQFDYFYEHSQLIKRSVNKIGGTPLVDSKDFQNLFSRVLQGTTAVEYYLLDENCSYIFLDQKGRQTKLLIKSKDQLECEYGRFHIPREICCGGLFPLDPDGEFFYEIK